MYPGGVAITDRNRSLECGGNESCLGGDRSVLEGISVPKFQATSRVGCVLNEVTGGLACWCIFPPATLSGDGYLGSWPHRYQFASPIALQTHSGRFLWVRMLAVVANTFVPFRT